MKRTLLFGLFFGLFFWGTSQTIYENYRDGALYVRLTDAAGNQWPEFDARQSAVIRLPSDLAELVQEFAVWRVWSLHNLYAAPETKGLYKILFDDFQRVDELHERFLQLPYVAQVEKQELLRHFLTPNDYTGVSATALDRVNAESAWDLSTGSPNVVIAVVDDALFTSHEDINANVWVNTGETANGLDSDGDGFIDNVNGYDVSDNDPNVNPPGGGFEHGTFVGSSASAVTNNNRGIAALGHSCSLMGIKATRDIGDPQFVEDGYEGVLAALDMGADIINMSWGSENSSPISASIISSAHNAGAILVSAAGNDSHELIQYPAGYPEVISVGATNRSNDEVTGYSNFGTLGNNWVDVYAPGNLRGCGISSTTSYYNSQGTSFSSPMVAGLAGLLKAYNPSMTNTQIRACIQEGCDNIDAFNPSLAGRLGFGRINARASLDCALPIQCDSTALGELSAPSVISASAFNVGATGYVGGTNSLNHSNLAIRFNEYKGYDRLIGVALRLADVVDGGNNSNINFILAVGDTTLGPTVVLNSVSVSLSEIASAFNGGASPEYLVEISPSVPLPANGFFLVISIPNGPGDVFALQAQDLAATAPEYTTWVQASSAWARSVAVWGANLGYAAAPFVTSSVTDFSPQFTFNDLGNNTFEFVGQGNGSDMTYFWDFGDGSGGSGTTVTHAFDDPGTYTVSLFATNFNCQQIVSQSVSATSARPEGLPEGFALYPNPGKDRLFLEVPAGTQTVELELLNLLGQSVMPVQRLAPQGERVELSVSEIPAGAYLVRLIADNRPVVVRWLKQ